jgi:site-specific DNA recombinase
LIKKAVAIYLRGEKQEQQLELCQEYVRLYLGEAVENCLIFQDEGSLAEELPGLQSLMAAVNRNVLHTVVCSDIGVICKNTAELVETVRQLESKDTALILVKNAVDFSTAMGRSVLLACNTFLELERASAASNIRDNMRMLARSGRWLGGVTPTGYTSVRKPGKQPGEKNYCLQLLPEQAETVKLIYSLFLEWDSLVKVTQELESRGIRTKNGRAFSRFTLRQILENPVYMQASPDAYAYFTRLGAEVCSPQQAFDGSRGMMVYNKTLQARGVSNQQRDVSEWIVAVGEHQPIIDALSWIAVQQQLARNKSPHERRPKSEFGLVAEMLYCGECGAHMRPKLISRASSEREPRFFYICERKEQSRSSECDIPNLPGQTVDHAISTMLCALGPDEPDLLPIRPRRPATAEALEAHQARIAKKKQQIASNEEGISKLVFTLIKAIDKSAYDEIIQRIDMLHQRNQQLSAQVEALESLTSPSPLEDHYREALEEILAQWEKYSQTTSMTRRRAALRVLIDSVTWDREELLVRFSGGAEFAVRPD